MRSGGVKKTNLFIAKLMKIMFFYVPLQKSTKAWWFGHEKPDTITKFTKESKFV